MKSLLTTLLLSSSILGFSQRLEKISNFKQPEYHKTFELKQTEEFKFRTYGSEWFNLHNDLVNEYFVDGNTAASPLNGMPIFPDSTIYLAVSSVTNEPITAWIHGAADVITPSMTPGNWISPWGEVIIDSIDIFNSYQRTTASNIVDTLFIDYLQTAKAVRLFGTDQTVDVGDFLHQKINYDYLSNSIPLTDVLRRDTVYLTEADSSSFISSLKLDVNDTIQGGNQYGVYVSFQPGYTWTKNDDTIGNYNTFFLISREQSYEGDPAQFWDAYAPFSSYILPQDVRYNQAGAYNGMLVSSFAYPATFGYEHHYFWYKLTSSELGIKDVNINVKNVGSYPNPAVNFTNISFDLVNEADVVLKVTDLTGRTVAEYNYGKLMKGNHIKTLDLAGLKTGNYSVSVNGSAKIITVLK